MKSITPTAAIFLCLALLQQALGQAPPELPSQDKIPSQDKLPSQDTMDVTISKASGKHGKDEGVKGAKQCGGPAEFHQFRVVGCDKANTCKVKASGGKLHAQLDFVPVIDMAQMKFKVYAVLPGQPVILHDAPIKNSAVQKKTKYTVHMKLDGNPALSGQTTTVKYELYNAADNSLRVCVEFEVEWESDAPTGNMKDVGRSIKIPS